ncbi:MAG: hypothetical protein SPJ51_02475 [Candidatus Enterosoma sp.]|nr:hypothetical protein [bacterium]MDY5909660.1 hypothetical protein [Candidatus Enterosoma sp.]
MKNLNKSKIVGVAAVSLAAVSLIGVGFASWVISGITNPNLGDKLVSVTVGDVTDNRATITATMSDDKLCFDAKSNDHSGAIQYTGETGGEDLTFAIKVKTSSVASGNINVKAKIENYDTCKLKSAITSGYLTGPAIGPDSNKVTLNDTAQIVTTLTSTDEVTLAFTLGWGTKFGGFNPAEYEDHGGNVSTIVTDLQGFKDLDNPKGSLGFTVVLTAELASK